MGARWALGESQENGRGVLQVAEESGEHALVMVQNRLELPELTTEQARTSGSRTSTDSSTNSWDTPGKKKYRGYKHNPH